MTNFKRAIPCLLAVCCIWSGGALAQDDAEDRADVWSIIEQQWDAVENGDRKWTERFLADDFSGWPRNSP